MSFPAGWFLVGDGLTGRLRRGLDFFPLWVSRQLRYPKVSKGGKKSPLVRPQAPIFCLDGRLTCRDGPKGCGCERKAPCKQRCKPTLPKKTSGGLMRRISANWDLPSYGFLGSFGIRRFPKGERKAIWCARRRNPPFSNEGMTRRLRRGRWGCRPAGGSTFFRSERKYQRKPAARRLREKGFYCPFCRRGSQCRAQ